MLTVSLFNIRLHREPLTNLHSVYMNSVLVVYVFLLSHWLVIVTASPFCRLNSRPSLRQRIINTGPVDLELELGPVPRPDVSNQGRSISPETAQVRPVLASLPPHRDIACSESGCTETNI